MIDDRKSGEVGKFIVLGYRLNGCNPPSSTDTCRCSGNVCIGKGAEGGCPFPLCKPEQVEHLLCGYKLSD